MKGKRGGGHKGAVAVCAFRHETEGGRVHEEKGVRQGGGGAHDFTPQRNRLSLDVASGS